MTIFLVLPFASPRWQTTVSHAKRKRAYLEWKAIDELKTHRKYFLGGGFPFYTPNFFFLSPCLCV